MKVLFVEAGKRPVVKEIDGTLKSMQNLVGGLIQLIYPFEDPVGLVCNEEAKILGMPLNRGVYDKETCQLIDIVAGDFFLCGAPDDSDDLTSLTEEQISKYQKVYACPENFIKMGGRIMVIKEI